MTASGADGTTRLVRVLRGERLDPPPVWLMRQAGRYLPEYRDVRARAGGFLELCFDPALAAEVTLQPVRRFDLDAAILFADILLVPMALGVELSFETGEGPRLTPLRDSDDVAALRPAEAVDAALAPVCATVARVRAALPAGTAVIGFAGAPWTVATYMVEGGSSRDFAATRRWAMADPAGFARIIDRVSESTIRYLSAQIAAGADAVQLFDSWAGALPAEQLEAWVHAPTRAIVAALKARHPQVPVIGFPRGIGAAVPDYVRFTGVDAVGLDSGLDLAWADRALPRGFPVQGNLDPLWLELGGPAMQREVARVLAAGAGRPHVFNLGHGIVKETPPEHVAALVAAVRG
ncbi:MAG: uroporphyrinogen decarboxylase [Alphaproteobacteria bacterium]